MVNIQRLFTKLSVSCCGEQDHNCKAHFLPLNPWRHPLPQLLLYQLLRHVLEKSYSGRCKADCMTLTHGFDYPFTSMFRSFMHLLPFEVVLFAYVLKIIVPFCSPVNGRHGVRLADADTC